MGEAFLSAFLEVLFDRLASREVIEFIRGRKLDDRLLKKLKIILPMINAVLNDAEEKQISNPAVKEWLSELKDAVYHAEDLVDEIATEALRCKLEAECQINSNQVWNIISTSFNPFNEGIESKIEEITEKLEFIAKQKDVLGLKEGVRGKTSQRLPTTSLVNDSCVFGRDIDKEMITKLLLCDEQSSNELFVIPIVGMGGVGKTTLAQLAYNDDRIKEHFDLKVWVYVSEEFDAFRVTKTVLESVTLSTCDFKDLNMLQVRLKESLEGKKFLLVLDDYWNENYNDWDVLRSPFRSGIPGSKIIVTTCNEGVASIMQTVPTHHLKQLSYEDCWSLFVKHAYENGNCSPYPKLEVIGREIVKKCKGLPLAAKTLGGLVRSKVGDAEWENVLNSDIWELPTEKSDILPSLRLSYLHLPAHLKQCFAYCSIFPKGFEFNKDELVSLWMAEGLVRQPRRKKRTDEVGDEYFNDLLSRSFFQQSSGNDSLFIMHDLINDLAQFVSGEFCLRLEDDKQNEVSPKTRHLSYIRGEYDAIAKFEVFTEVKSLRTFLPLNLPHNIEVCHISSQVPHFLLPALKDLRVLSLSHYGITELPDSIGGLKYLRYLDLSYTGIKELPRSTSALYNLQTLILHHCRSLSKMPPSIGSWTNLCHFDISGSEITEMPMQLGKLKSLQKMPTFVVGKNTGSAIKELSELMLLQGTISILGLENVVNRRDAMEANLKEKRLIDDLVLEWASKIDASRNETTESSVLDKLQPHEKLKRLTIRHFAGSRFPKWLGDPSFVNMVFLSLSNLENCTSLPSLGKLPSLKNLSIEGMNKVESVGLEFYGDGCSPFQSLEVLRFDNMQEWKEWYPFVIKEEGGFPCLKELYLHRCPKLMKEIPNNCPTLEKLVIHDCTDLVSSLPRLVALQNLELKGCNKLVLTSVNDFTSLGSLHISKISNLTCLPKGFLKHLKAVEDLTVGGCGEITTLSNQVGFQHLTSLQKLEIYGCPKLENLPYELHCLTCLTELKIEGCPGILSFPEMGLPAMLTHLTIEECQALQSLPEGLMCNNTNLEYLCISGCSSLTSFPGGLESFLRGESLITNLKSFLINECESLVSLPDGINKLTSLQELHICDCPCLAVFPEGGLPINLTSLWIESCENLKSLPTQIHNVSSLQELYIKGCPGIMAFPDEGLPTNIESLRLANCRNLIRCIGMEFYRLTSLRNLSIRGCPGLVSFPGDWLLPTTLTSLCISELPDLKIMSEEILHLTSLEKLEIRECHKLLSLPEHGLPFSLSFLEIWKCPMLNKRCLKKKGEDWHKIAHISCIKYDYKVIL